MARGWALALLTVAVYLPSLAGGFIWDDWVYVVAEPLIRRWDGIVGIWLAELREKHYWPLVYTSFWLEHKVWGLHPVGYRAVNLGLHVLNALLLWRLLLRLGIPGAWLAAAVFAVHPIHVESVAWIIQRKDQLSGFLYLTAVLVWVRHGSVPTPGRTLACLALFGMALLSKSIAVTLPAALLLLRWWQAGRLAWRDVRHVLPFVALGAAIAVADLWLYRSSGAVRFDYSVLERVLIAGRAVWVYTAQLAWPGHLPVFYDRWDVHAGDVAGWCAVAALGGLAAMLWAARGRLGRGPLAGIGFFGLTLSPTLGFVDFDSMAATFVADRFAYLASIGLIAVVVGAAVGWVRDAGNAGRVGMALAAVLGLGALGSLTWQQAQVWRTDAALVRHAAALNPQHWAVQASLGSVLLAEGREEDALAAASRGARLAEQSRGVPPHAANHMVGMVLLALDRPAEAERWYAEDLAMGMHRFGLGRARRGLAEALVRQARYAEGLAAYRQHLESEPSDDTAHARLAAALAVAGDHAAAAEAYRRALAVVRYLGNGPHWERALGEALAGAGRWEEAVVRLDRSLALNPRNIWTLIARARLEAARPALRGGGEPSAGEREGRSPSQEEEREGPSPSHDAPRTGQETRAHPGRQWLERAREVAEQAREREPENALGPIALGAVLLQVGAYADARDLLREALSMAPNRAQTRQTHKLLGEALEAQGQTTAATDHYRRALELYALDHEALERLATIHRDAGRLESALPLWRTHADVRPRLATAHWRLGETLHLLGRPAAALAALERALAIDPALTPARRLHDTLRQTPPAAAARDGQAAAP